MKKFIEDKDKYIIQRWCKDTAHEKSIFSIEIYPGIIAEFGEPKSKLGSKRYELLEISFLKKRYSKDRVLAFWSKFHVKYIPYKYNGKKMVPIYRVLGSPQNLIHGGYIVIYKNTSGKRKSIKEQRTFNFWKDEFYNKGILSTDTDAINATIPLIIDRLKDSPELLKEMPNEDHRILEEIIAEIFREFGYSIELTKRTRDGGKDIICLKKNAEGKEEKILIECKHWKRKVNVNVVRNLIGVAVSQEILPTGIILAATSCFTKDAEKVAINGAIKMDLELKDYEDIIEWIREYSAIQMSKNEINTLFECCYKV